MTHEQLTALFERLRTASDDVVLTPEEASVLVQAALTMSAIILWSTKDIVSRGVGLMEDDIDAYRVACAVEGRPVDENILTIVDDEEDGDE